MFRFRFCRQEQARQVFNFYGLLKQGARFDGADKKICYP